ncbi:MAG: Radical domain protein [Deltaproteobacteria bacterium]|nr:Radical domain protein [Deltaproteobacteria bacterium]
MRKNRPQCGLLIENSEGKVLLQLRDDRPDIPYPNCWGTFGGQVEINETPEQAIKREIKEELEYEASHPEYFGNFPFDGYDIYMYRIIDPNVTLDNIRVKEGQRGDFFDLEQIRYIPCAFNCRDIVIAYFSIYR